jgi:hypothetical protein
MLVGWQTRWAALGMAIFTVVITFIFHAFWAVPAEQVMQQQQASSRTSPSWAACWRWWPGAPAASAWTPVEQAPDFTQAFNGAWPVFLNPRTSGDMAKTVVVYHSGYGHTQRMAQAVAEGAGAQLLAIDADGNLPEGGWERWLRPMPSSSARPPTWAA